MASVDDVNVHLCVRQNPIFRTLKNRQDAYMQSSMAFFVARTLHVTVFEAVAAAQMFSIILWSLNRRVRRRPRTLHTNTHPHKILQLLGEILRIVSSTMTKTVMSAFNIH